MGNFFKDIFSKSVVGGALFGGDDKSRTDGVNYPSWYEDPNFKGSQDYLSQYSKDLLDKGPNDYYKPIGEYGTSQFMDFMQQGNAKTMMGVDESLARTGRARGGQGAQIAAQTLGDKNANLMYNDYLRAMNGRQNFMNIGLNTQANVRDAAFGNQESRNKFNVGGAEFDYNKAVYGDTRDDAASAAMGKIFGTAIQAIPGMIAGGAVGGPVGAIVGGIGSASGSGSQWLDMLNQSKTTTSGGGSTAGVENGVSGLGAIDPSEFVNNYSPKFGKQKPASMFNSSMFGI